LDVAACYCPEVLNDLFDRLPASFNLHTDWVKQSPLIKAVTPVTPTLTSMNKGNITTDSRFYIEYGDWANKDASGKTRLSWAAHRGDWPAIQSYQENHMPNFLWQQLTEHPLREALREAMHAGQYPIVKELIQYANKNIYLVNDGLCYINKNGLEVMKPIIDCFLHAKSDDFSSMTYHGIAKIKRYGCRVDNTNIENLEIKRLAGVISPSNVKTTIAQESLPKEKNNLSIGTNSNILMPANKASEQANTFLTDQEVNFTLY
jgi:hypothetical protein